MISHLRSPAEPYLCPVHLERAQRLAARTGADLWLVLSEALDWGLARLEGPDDP